MSITSGQYIGESMKLLNELKNSISFETRTNLQKDFKENDYQEFNEFFRVNTEEINNFLKSTPRKRSTTKKWQKDYNLYAYGAYMMLLVVVSRYLLIDWRFHQENSYRKDLAKIALIMSKSETVPNLFFEEQNHKELRWF